MEDEGQQQSENDLPPNRRRRRRPQEQPLEDDATRILMRVDDEDAAASEEVIVDSLLEHGDQLTFDWLMRRQQRRRQQMDQRNTGLHDRNTEEQDEENEGPPNEDEDIVPNDDGAQGIDDTAQNEVVGNQDNNPVFFGDMMIREDNMTRRIWALRAARESISSNLFMMVQEGRTCTSVLSGWGISKMGSCDSIVQHCAANTEEAMYVSRNGRMPLHEACLRGACRHVIRALLEATKHRGAIDRDHHGNTPLHLLFVDSSLSSSFNSNIVWSPEDLAQVVGDLMANNPGAIAASSNNDGNTPLHSACMAPETMVDPSTIVRLLQANPRAASKMNRKNETPLRLHCQRRNASPEVAKLLLHQNPDALIGLDNEKGWAPIHAAAACGNFPLLQYMVEAFPEAVKVRTLDRKTTLHILCAFHAHLSTNHSNETSAATNVEEAVQFLLEADPEAILHQDTIHGYTPLHLVCKTGASRQVPLSIIELLLKCNPGAAAVPDFQKYLPLHYACAMGCSQEVIQALLKAHPLSSNALTTKLDSPLSLACICNKSPETVDLLLKANPEAMNQTNEYGFGPLHCSCRAHQPRMGIVKALIEAHPESVLKKTSAGETPLYLVGSNHGAFAGVVQLLTQTQNRLLQKEKDQRKQEPKTSFLEEIPLEEQTEKNFASLEPPASKSERLLAEASGKMMFARKEYESDDDDMGNPFRHNDSDVDEHPFRSRSRSPSFIRKTATNNKMGNTPLHEACFRSTPYENLEEIAKANPEYILVRNNAGYTPLQILCKSGRIDERIISTFAHMGGPEIFSVKDSNGNTPLHLALRKDVDVSSLCCLIRAFPEALVSRTIYGDSPLHLACLRKCSHEVIREVAMASSRGDISPALVPNLAGQTPIGIAMADFSNICRNAGICNISAAYQPNQRRIVLVLSTLVKIVHYGPLRCQQEGMKDLSLLRACVVLHRQNIRLDPAFIRQVIHMYPEEVKLADKDGNYPLHIEASIPVEKMPLLDGTGCRGKSHSRMGILRILLEAYPNACSMRNKEDHFPLGLMINSGRLWGHTIAVALRAFPPALHWYKGIDDRFCSILFEKASKECGADTLFSLLVSRPGLFDVGTSSSVVNPYTVRNTSNPNGDDHHLP